MKRKISATISKWIFILPAVIAVIIMIRGIYLTNRHIKDYTTAIYNEAVNAVQTMAVSIQGLDDNGINEENDYHIILSSVGNALTTINKVEGVNVRVVDLDFNILYENQKIEDLYTTSLFSPEYSGFEELKHKMDNTLEGEARVKNDEGKEFLMYWKIVPAPPNEKAYIVLTLDIDRVLHSTRQGDYMWNTAILCILLMFSTWDSLYLRMKQEHEDNE